DRVLRGDGCLIIVAVECPCLDLRARQLPVVQQAVERVMDVIALRPDGAQLSFQPVGGHGARGRWGCVGQSSKSSPSCATIHPAACASARSGESASSTGFELFIWMITFCRTSIVRNASIVPP